MACAIKPSKQPNILIITVDDMSADSLGVYGCTVGDTSPHIDAFARTALRFKHAHVQVGNCMPGRNIMWSGLYAHQTGVEGFVQNPNADYPVLCDLAQQAGYFSAIRGKVSHSTPYTPYAWDAVLDVGRDGKKYHVKDPQSYGESTRQGIALAKDEDKPFCLMINISDPHKPFYARGSRAGRPVDRFTPSKIFEAEDITVPGFLFEDEQVREELALYYSSVRRADDAFGEIHSALVDTGHLDDTFVFFCSDHGMPLPFAKTQLYYHSTRTPLMIRWPGVTPSGEMDEMHMVSAVDFLPTLLDVMDHPHPTPDRLQGRSFAPLLRGFQQSERDFVILQYNENSGGNRHPIRGVQTKESLYLFNPWSDGNRKFATATTGTVSYRRMQELSSEDADISRRLHLFDYRVLQEFYDIQSDSDCLENLIGYTEHKQKATTLRGRLKTELERIDDPVAVLLKESLDHQEIERYMNQEDQRAIENREKRRAKRGKSKRPEAGKLGENALQFRHSGQVEKESSCRIEISFDLPREIGKQKLHVTLKRVLSDQTRALNERIDRQVVEVEGKASVELFFDIPTDLEVKAVRFAAFIGEDFGSNRIYEVGSVIEIKD
ncbi:sulfatase [bacterium]|nr:sulfatase [bacterium]